MNFLASRLSTARRLLVALAVLAGLLAPLLFAATSADAATKHRTCGFGAKHSYYRSHHPYWWAHHCPRRAAAMAGRAVAAAPTSTVRGTAQEQFIAWRIEDMINAERRAHGLAPVGMDANLVLGAQRHNLEMAKYNQMSHQLPDEADLGARIDTAGYHWSWAGENVAWNSQMSLSGVQALQTMMYNEQAPNDGHRQNILNSHFRNVGVNAYVDTVHHRIWLTTDFGSK